MSSLKKFGCVFIAFGLLISVFPACKKKSKSENTNSGGGVQPLPNPINQTKYTLTINQTDSHGIIKLADNSVLCTSAMNTCSIQVSSGTNLELIAEEPDQSVVFNSWMLGGGVQVSNKDIAIVVDQDKVIAVQFLGAIPKIFVHKVGTGSGLIYTDDSRILCGFYKSIYPSGIDCGETYPTPIDLNLHILADQASKFTSIKYSLTGAPANNILHVDHPIDLDVEFTRYDSTLDITILGAGYGEVVYPDYETFRISGCLSKFCTEYFDKRSQQVLLKARPISISSVFSGWGGDCTGTGDCLLMLDGSKKITARFD